MSRGLTGLIIRFDCEVFLGNVIVIGHQESYETSDTISSTRVSRGVYRVPEGVDAKQLCYELNCERTEKHWKILEEFGYNEPG